MNLTCSLRLGSLTLALSACVSTSTPSPETQRRVPGSEGPTREEFDARGERLKATFLGLYLGAIDASLLPPVDALVAGVTEGGFVSLDKGAPDGVEVGDVFEVYRGTTYKGQVRITTVEERSSSGQILFEVNPIAPGDAASTFL